MERKLGVMNDSFCVMVFFVTALLMTTNSHGNEIGTYVYYSLITDTLHTSTVVIQYC